MRRRPYKDLGGSFTKQPRTGEQALLVGRREQEPEAGQEERG